MISKTATNNYGAEHKSGDEEDLLVECESYVRRGETGSATRNNRDSSADGIPHSKSHKQNPVRTSPRGESTVIH